MANLIADHADFSDFDLGSAPVTDVDAGVSAA